MWQWMEKWKAALLKFVRRLLRWSFVNQLMRLRISQAAAAIPILGYALLWSQKLSEWLVLQEALGSNGGIWFNVVDRLMLLYVGSVLLTLSWLIYLFRCPSPIKESTSLDDFVIRNMQMHDDITLGRIRNILRMHVLPGEAGGQVFVYSPLVPATLTDEYSAARLNNHLGIGFELEPNRSAIYRCYYLFRDGEAPVFIALAAVLFVLGSFVFLLPSAEVFVMVATRLLY